MNGEDILLSHESMARCHWTLEGTLYIMDLDSETPARRDWDDSKL